MTLVLEINCPDKALAMGVILTCLTQLNAMSRLRFNQDDPEYVTREFGLIDIFTHTTIPDCYWLDYDPLYEGLGDDGRTIAMGLIGTIDQPGLALRAPLIANKPETLLYLKNIPDLIAAGYLPPPSP